MVKAKYFGIQEYVPQHIYERRGEKAWELIDSRLIVLNDRLRARFGRMIINTWHSPRMKAAYGLRQWSGLRTAEFYRQPDDSDIQMYARYDRSLSQHKYGRGSDGLFADTPVNEVREYILAHPDEFPELMAVELGTSWLHGDVRNCARIKTFNA